ncbi:MMPL family transporter [Actinomadura monticuli]|uniref:MMPL family transporter n=1 Tax=Actinomadura monticuli TaxID=3097367 RepID=A0ABV4QEF1_9ACTN
MQDFKRLGVGLSVAVLIDATIVRVVLLPAVMILLGRANWYLPRWLDRLPGISHGEAPGLAAGPAPAPPVRGLRSSGRASSAWGSRCRGP